MSRFVKGKPEGKPRSARQGQRRAAGIGKQKFKTAGFQLLDKSYIGRLAWRPGIDLPMIVGRPAK